MGEKVPEDDRASSIREVLFGNGNTRPWVFKIFDCFKDLAVCTTTCVLPWVTSYQLQKQLNKPIAALLAFTVGFIQYFCFALLYSGVFTFIGFLGFSNENDTDSEPSGFSKALLTTAGVLVIVLSIIRTIMLIKGRYEFRKFLSLNGSLIEDSLLAFFCSNCVICQMKMELDTYEEILRKQELESLRRAVRLTAGDGGLDE